MSIDDRRDNSQVMHSIGELTGAVREMNAGLTRRINDIREDIQKLDRATNERMDRLEAGLNRRIDDVSSGLKAMDESVGKRIDSLGTRVTNLEAEDKRIIKDVARMSAMGGGVGGALVTGLVELLKQL